MRRGAGGKYYNTAEKIAARIGVITKIRRFASCLRTEIGEYGNGRPTLAWHFDQEVLQAEADGWYALLTALTPEQAERARSCSRGLAEVPGPPLPAQGE